MAGLLCLLVLAVFMIPGYGYIRLEYPLVIVLMLNAVGSGRFGRIRYILLELGLLYALMLCGALSIFVYYSGHTGFHWRDLTSVLRLPVYGLIIAGALFVPMDTRLKRVLGTLIFFCGVIGTLVSIVQYFNIAGLNTFFLKLYRSNVWNYVDQFIYGTQERRIIGTAGNPNLWGFVLACYAIFIFSRVVLARGFLLLPVLFGVIVSIAMTGSRSALLSFVIGSVTILFGSFRFARVRGPLLIVSAVMTLALPIALVFIAQSLGSERYDMKNVESMYLRFHTWSETLKEYQDDLLLGRGPTKFLQKERAVKSTAAALVRDNNYVSAVAETGIIGLLLLLALFATMWRHLWRLAPRVPPVDLHWVLSGLGVMTAWIAFNGTADGFNTVYLSHNVWVLYGLTLAIAYTAIESEKAALIRESARSQNSYLETSPAVKAPLQPVGRL
jgi:O-antigen ligase